MTVKSNIKTTRAGAGAEVLRRGLSSVGLSAITLAKSITKDPSAENLTAVVEGADSISKQLTDLVDGTSRMIDENENLQRTLSEMEETSGWFGEVLSGGSACGTGQCTPIGNCYGRVVSGFDSL